MKILLIHQYFLQDGEGGGARWNEMTRYWVREGHDVTVLAGTAHYMGSRRTHNFSQFSYATINQDGVLVWWCRTTQFKHGWILGRLVNYCSYIFTAIVTGLFRSRVKYDLIVATSPPLLIAIVAIILSWIKRIPYVFEVRDIWPDSAADLGLLKNPLALKLALFLENLAYERASLINVLTPAFRDVLIRNKHVAPEKICFIPNAANLDLADQLGAHFDLANFRSDHNMLGHFVLCYVGAHGAANHLVQLVRVAEHLKPQPVLFVLIGDGPEKEILKSMVEQTGLLNFRFYDVLPRETVFQFILASDAGISILAKNESFKTVYSNKTFDYFACGKPILMVIDGVSRELVESAKAGLYAEPENTESMVSQIKYLLEHREEAQQMGANGHQYAKMHFDREKLASQYLHFISQIADL